MSFSGCFVRVSGDWVKSNGRMFLSSVCRSGWDLATIRSPKLLTETIVTIGCGFL